MKAILIIAILLLSVAIMGCTTIGSQETSTPTENEINETFSDFENTLLDENNDIDVGSMI